MPTMNTIIKFIRYYITHRDGGIDIEGFKPNASDKKNTSRSIFDILPSERDAFEAKAKVANGFVRMRHVIQWDENHPDFIRPPKGAPKGAKNAKVKNPRRQATIRIKSNIYDKLVEIGNGNVSKAVEDIVRKYEET